MRTTKSHTYKFLFIGVSLLYIIPFVYAATTGTHHKNSPEGGCHNTTCSPTGEVSQGERTVTVTWRLYAENNGTLQNVASVTGNCNFHKGDSSYEWLTGVNSNQLDAGAERWVTVSNSTTKNLTEGTWTYDCNQACDVTVTNDSDTYANTQTLTVNSGS